MSTPETAASSEGRREGLQRRARQMRQDIEPCLSLMARCTTREDILSGFAESARLLRNVEPGHPMAESAEWALREGAFLGEAEVIRLRDDFVDVCRHFVEGAAKAAGLR